MFYYLILVLVGTATADFVYDGKCPNVTPVANFDLKAYEGTWREVGMLTYYNYTIKTCTTTEYKVDGDKATVRYWYVDNGVQMYMNGTVRYAEDSNKSANIIHFFELGDNISTVLPSYIVATDYTSYAIAYMCVYYEYMSIKSNFKFAAVLSRSMTLEGNARKAVDTFLQKHSDVIDPSQMVYFDLSDKLCSFTASEAIKVPGKFTINQ